MSQQFTPSTNGSNLSIAAGASPAFVERKHGNQWRADAVLKVANLDTLRTMQVVEADSFLVGDLGHWEWDGASTATDSGTESAAAVAVTGVAVGRYVRKGSGLALNGTPVLSVNTDGSMRTVTANGVATQGIDTGAPVADLTALAALSVGRGVTVYVVGNGPWLSVPRASVNPDGVNQIAGVYSLTPIGWIKLNQTSQDTYYLERAIVDRAALASSSFWFHPDFGKTITGAQVTAWLDYLTTLIPGHSAHNCTDPLLPANRWNIGAMANGCPALEDNGLGTSHLLLGGAASAAGSHTFCAVIDLQSAAGNQVIVCGTAANDIGFTIATTGQLYGTLFNSVSFNPIAEADCLTGEQTIAWVYDSAAGSCSVYFNGKKIATATGQIARAFAPLSLGFNGNGPNCKLASCVYVNRADATLVSTFHNWAVQRCGVPNWSTINLYDDQELDSSIDLRMAFSQQQVTTSARKMILEWDCEIPAYPTMAFVSAHNPDNSLIVAGGYSGTPGTQTVEKTLPVGPKTVIVRDGTQLSLGGYPINKNAVRKVHLQAPGSLDTVAAPAKRLVVYGDSISVGWYTTQPQTEAYVNLLRSTYAGRVSAYGRGALAFKHECETEPQRVIVANRIAAMLDGTITNQLWIALGWNDNGIWPTAALTAAYADLLDKIHALKPAASIFAQSPITATVETGLPAIRTAISNACTGREWVTYIDGTTITAALSGDGIHPTTAGNVTYAAFISARV